MNRITSAIARTEKQIVAANLTDDAAKRLSCNLDLSFEEHFKYQQMKSEMFANGGGGSEENRHSTSPLNLEESQLLYEYLGGTASVFNKRPLVVKVVLTKLFSELLALRIGGVA